METENQETEKLRARVGELELWINTELLKSGAELNRNQMKSLVELLEKDWK